MYSTPLGRALNYGQSMIPGKARKAKPGVVRQAVLQKRQPKKKGQQQ